MVNNTTEQSGIRKILSEINPTNEADVLNLVIQKFTTAEKFRTTQVDRWDKFYKYYRGYTEPKDKAWKTNLSLSTAYIVIDTLLPRIMITLFSPKFMVQMLPREKRDKELAGLVEGLIKYQFDTMEAFTKLYIWIKGCLLYGTSILKVFWRIETVERAVFEPVYFLGIKLGRKRVKKKIIVYDGPDIEPIDLYNFYIDPRATCIKDAGWCIHRVFRNYDYLIQMQKKGYYKNIEKVKPGVGELAGISNNIRATVSGLPTGITDDDKYKVELLEYWENSKVITVANRTVIIRDEKENPLGLDEKPFIDIKDTIMPHEFYGIGEIEPIESAINERIELRNQALENVKAIVNKILIANRNADIDFDRLDEQNRAGGIILTDDINALKYLEQTNIVSDLYSQDALLIKDIQDTTAMADWTVGGMPRKTETATAVMQVQQSAASRFTLKIQNIVNSGIIPLIKIMIALNQQFLGKNKVIRILGEEGEEFPEISAEDISGNYDLIPAVGVFEATKDAERQQLLLLANNPLFTLPNVNIEEFQKEILKKFFDGIDVDRFIGKMPEMPEGEVMPNVAGRGVRAEKKQKQATGVPSIAGVGGIPGPQIS